MSEQSSLSHFGSGDSSQTDQYECGICGRSFDSAVGRGNHRASHSDEQIEQELISELHRLYQKIGHTPTWDEMNQRGKISPRSYTNHFGSWNNGIQAANLDITHRQDISKEKIIDAITQLAEKLDRPPKRREMDEEGKITSGPCMDTFGSWNEALRAAGYQPVHQTNISRQELINELQRLAKKLDSLPTQETMMSDEAKFSFRPYIDEFGSWNEALQAAGYQPVHQTNISRQELINELQQFAKELGHTPSFTEMDEKGPFSTGLYVREFGSWNEALQEGGFALNGRHDIPQRELEDELQRLAKELGHSPEKREMDEEGKFSSGLYQDTFGSWNDALRLVGLEPLNQTDISESKLQSALKQFAEELGRTPSYTEMDRDGPYAGGTYVRKFGSWNKALREAGLDPNNVYVPDHLDHKVRSTYEEEIADILLDEYVEYEYEPESSVFEYGTDRTYTPDFVTDQYVIEVKGYVYSNEVEKAEIAMEQLDHKKYVVIQDSGSKLPADRHIQWSEREKLRQLL